MTTNKIKAWNQYMSGNVGDSGYYISVIRGPKEINYGPFKKIEVAEFFNFIAFCSPRDMMAKESSKNNIAFFESPVGKSDHPSNMFASNSKFGLWLMDTYKQPLTTDLVLNLAKESGAKGYNSFKEWLLHGSIIQGQHLALCDIN